MRARHGMPDIGHAPQVRKRTPMVTAAIAMLVGYWMLAALVLAIDPYDVYPWGWRARSTDLKSPDNSVYDIAAAAKLAGVDTVMIGASESSTYTPAQMQQAWRDTHHPWNISYPGVAPADRALVLATFERYSQARRYVIWVEWSYVLPARTMQARFPEFLYDRNVINDLRMVNQVSLAATLRLLRGDGMFDRGTEESARELQKEAATYTSFQTGASMHAITSLIASHHEAVARPWRAPCSRYPALNSQLVPALRRLSARQVRVDLVFPAFSAAAYYAGAFRGTGPSLPEQLNLRRCTVLAVSRLPGVSVWAPDLDRNLITDLANFRNATHLHGDATLMMVLARIGDPRFRIDMGNLESYLSGLRATVIGYRVKNSALGMDGNDGS